MRGAFFTAAALMATCARGNANSFDEQPAHLDRFCGVTRCNDKNGCSTLLATYPADRVVLFDSFRHKEVIDERAPVYTRWQADSNVGTGRFEGLSQWGRGIGGLCRRDVFACGYTLGWQDNWVMSPFISNNGAAEVFTGTETTILCHQRQKDGCRAKLEYYVKQVPSSAEADKPVLGNTADFDAYYTVTGNTVNEETTRSIKVQPGMAGFYLVARDNGTCASVGRMQAWVEADAAEPVAPVSLRVTQQTCRGCGSDGEFAWQLVSKAGAVCDAGSVVPSTQGTQFTLTAQCEFAVDELSHVEVTADKARGGGDGWGIESVAVVREGGDVALRATRRSTWVKDIARRPQLKTLRLDVA